VKWIRDFFKNAEHYSQTRFYIAQRKRLNILLEADGRPAGGRWSFDPQNRRRLPPGLAVPGLPRFSPDAALAKAITEVKKRFPDHPGSAAGFFYPLNHEQARRWLEHFLEHSLSRFGDY
jgi:deoxyribodipyrimidine photolyase-related protein